MNWEIGYSRIIENKFVMHLDISYTGHDLYWSGFHDQDFSSGDVYARDDWFIDASFGYNVFHFYDYKFTVEAFTGPSFISGFDSYFNYIVDNSFGEVSVYAKYRNNPGWNLGFQLNYLPFSWLSFEARSKLHLFTKPPSDLSIGLLIGFRFGDPHFKKKKS